MKKITQKDISRKIRELINPEILEPRLPRLLEYLALQPKAPMMNAPQGQEEPPEAPTMPNVAGKQQLMAENVVAQNPFLGAR